MSTLLVGEAGHRIAAKAGLDGGLAAQLRAFR
jgi:hypothetical protein